MLRVTPLALLVCSLAMNHVSEPVLPVQYTDPWHPAKRSKHLERNKRKRDNFALNYKSR